MRSAERTAGLYHACHFKIVQSTFIVPRKDALAVTPKGRCDSLVFHQFLTFAMYRTASITPLAAERLLRACLPFWQDISPDSVS